MNKVRCNLTMEHRIYPMRILHFVSSISINSGVMMVIMNYYRNIDLNKIQFDLLYFIDNEPAKTYLNEIEQLGGRVYYITHPTNVFKYVKNLNEFFNEHKGEYLAIHIHEVYLAFLLAPIAHSHGLKVITHCHSTKFSDKPLRAIRNRIACLGINKFSDLRLACGQAAGEALYGKRAHFTVLNNAIDTKKFAFDPVKRSRLREQLGLNVRTVIGHIGRFNEQKNHKFLIALFYELQKTIPNAVLMLVGEGPLKEQIRKQVLALGLDSKVLFMGQRRDVVDLYNAMDLFCLPSLFEGFGIVLIEAQVNGLPCIASSSVPTEADIGNTTFVGLDEKVEEWIEIIIQKLQKKRTECNLPEKYKNIFEIKNVVKTLEELYLALLS